MKRSEFFERIMAIPKEEVFGMTYKKKNGETRVATCKLRDAIADVGVKGTGMNREEKMNRLQVFQYFVHYFITWMTFTVQNSIIFSS